MKSSKRVKEIENQLDAQYKKIVSTRKYSYSDDNEESLEQPYFGKIVDTTTTYSVCESPLAI